MEGCSKWRGDSVLHEVENGKGKVRFGFDLDFPIQECRFDACKERLRSLFYQLLVAFMREKSVCKSIRPLPALCGDGRAIDLFKLFWVTWKTGRYDAVYRNNLWSFVIKESGLRGVSIPSLKLIYMKYLNELDQWLRKVFLDRDLDYVETEVLQKLDSFSQELKARSFLASPTRQEEQKNEDEFGLSQYIKNGKDVEPNNVISGLSLLEIGRINEGLDIKGNLLHDEEDKVCNNDNHILLPSALRIGEKVICQMHDGSDRYIKKYDYCGKACIDHDSAASAKSVVKKVIGQVHGFSEEQVDDDNGKSHLVEDTKIVESAKKVIEKVNGKIQKSKGKNSDNEEKKSSVLENNGILASAKKVVEKVICNMQVVSCNITKDDGRFSAQNDKDTVMSVGSVLGTMFDSRKRKREPKSVSEMLNWLVRVAKHSDDPAIGRIPESSKWKDLGKEEFWYQALLVREALLIRRQDDTNTDESAQKLEQQKKLRMHPSMYKGDNLNQRASEKLRCSKRIPAKKSLPCSCCNSAGVPQSKVVNHKKAEAKSSPKESIVVSIKVPILGSQDQESSVPTVKQVFVGPFFQAEVPEWTGLPLKSDSKWLGRKLWPPEDYRNISITDTDPIRMGRQDHCICQFPGSVECVRFHVAEKRFKLKRELSLLFYHWQFDRMGEEVSLSWTKEEEMIFKEAISTPTAVRYKFWNNASRFLPTKTREKFVSYYFNVFLIHRRSYQNRVTPNDVDSDDDEKVCGSVGEDFGFQAIQMPGWRLIACVQNKESTDLV